MGCGLCVGSVFLQEQGCLLMPASLGTTEDCLVHLSGWNEDYAGHGCCGFILLLLAGRVTVELGRVESTVRFVNCLTLSRCTFVLPLFLLLLRPACMQCPLDGCSARRSTC